MNTAETDTFSIEPEVQGSGPNTPEHMCIWGLAMPYGCEYKQNSGPCHSCNPELTCTSGFPEAKNWFFLGFHHNPFFPLKVPISILSYIDPCLPNKGVQSYFWWHSGETKEFLIFTITRASSPKDRHLVVPWEDEWKECLAFHSYESSIVDLTQDNKVISNGLSCYISHLEEFGLYL